VSILYPYILYHTKGPFAKLKKASLLVKTRPEKGGLAPKHIVPSHLPVTRGCSPSKALVPHAAVKGVPDGWMTIKSHARRLKVASVVTSLAATSRSQRFCTSRIPAKSKIPVEE